MVLGAAAAAYLVPDLRAQLPATWVAQADRWVGRARDTLPDELASLVTPTDGETRPETPADTTFVTGVQPATPPRNQADATTPAEAEPAATPAPSSDAETPPTADAAKPEASTAPAEPTPQSPAAQASASQTDMGAEPAPPPPQADKPAAQAAAAPESTGPAESAEAETPEMPPPATAAEPPPAGAAADGDEPQTAMSTAPPPALDTAPDAPGPAVDAILTALPCARMGGRVDAGTGDLRLSGHIPSADAWQDLRADLRALEGIAEIENRDVIVLPEPLCGVVDTLVDLGFLPSEPDDLQVGVAAQASVATFRDAEKLRLDLTTPDFPAHVYIDYFESDGNVIHLLPSPRDRDNVFARPTVLRLGTEALVGPISVVPPFGTDLLVITASSEPLQDGLRPQFEPARDYLTALYDAVQPAGGGAPQRELTYLVIVTGP